MNPIIVLSFFNRKIGPSVFYSYPKNLSDEFSIVITHIMDQPLSESFFIHAFENFTSLNYYFEIYSDIARGNREMLMVSAIFEQQTTPEVEQHISSLLQKFSKSLQSDKEIFTAFHRDDLNRYRSLSL